MIIVKQFQQIDCLSLTIIICDKVKNICSFSRFILQFFDDVFLENFVKN